MKTVIYVGEMELGYVVDAAGRNINFVKGEPFEVPEELAATLGPEFEPAEQEN
jgi:hypothetical protein